MTGEDLRFAVLSFSALFLVVDPIAAVPIFVSITGDVPLDKKLWMAKRAAIAIFVTLVVFAVAGRVIFQLFGITLGSFKIAGGLMLFLMSIDMMRARSSPTRTTAVEQAESREREDVAIVPLALPMMAGPGAIATVVVLMSRAHGGLQTAGVIVAIALTSLACWLLLHAAARTEQLLQRTTIRVIERVMGLLLTAVAVEFIFSGLRDLLPTLQG
jgi:multiple antibiotic resistance protein